jgi:hypothetical protein
MVVIAADINGDVEDFEPLVAAQVEGELWDLGAIEHLDLKNTGICRPTCRAHGSKKDTRRDFIFANSKLLTCAREFWRGAFGLFDVHAPLSCAFTAGEKGPSIWKHRKPDPLIPAGMTKDERDEWQRRVHTCVGNRLQGAYHRLVGSLRRGDTDVFWQAWSSAVEEGFLDAAGKEEASRRPFRGHGQVRFYRTSLYRACKEAPQTGGQSPAPPRRGDP